jgi:hypothetical protein
MRYWTFCQARQFVPSRSKSCVRPKPIEELRSVPQACDRARIRVASVAASDC